MDVVESTDDTLYLDFHYCPLVKAWQKARFTDEEIARLCDIAMCGDHGIGKCFDAKLELPKAIAKGDDVCALRYIKAMKRGKTINLFLMDGNVNGRMKCTLANRTGLAFKIHQVLQALY